MGLAVCAGVTDGIRNREMLAQLQTDLLLDTAAEDALRGCVVSFDRDGMVLDRERIGAKLAECLCRGFCGVTAEEREEILSGIVGLYLLEDTDYYEDAPVQTASAPAENTRGAVNESHGRLYEGYVDLAGEKITFVLCEEDGDATSVAQRLSAKTNGEISFPSILDEEGKQTVAGVELVMLYRRGEREWISGARIVWEGADQNSEVADP